MINKTVAILGLGLFGAATAKTLAHHHVEVIGIDQNMERVEEVMDIIDYAVQGDFSKFEVLEAADIAQADIGIIAAGSRLESSIMGVLNLKKLGVKHIIVKTKNSDYLEVLKKVGADRVVLPEVEMGKRLGNEISRHSIIDSFRIDDNYNLVEIHALENWTGKSIIDLNLRQAYGFNIVALKSSGSQSLKIMIDPEYEVHEGDLFYVLVEEKDLEHFNAVEEAQED